MAITKREAVELRYLQRQRSPIWGGHLQRGQRLSDPQMQRWLDAGLIERVGNEGYVLSAKGAEELARMCHGNDGAMK